MKLIIASNNEHKVKEIKAILADRFDDILSLRDAGIEIDVIEDGETFKENAYKKAFEVMAVVDAYAVLADDSGLMVDALGGAPGVHSARFAGEGHDDNANNRKLLDMMRGVPDNDRTCRFVTAVALVQINAAPIICEGIVEGRLLHSPRGSSGFGYDPLFLYEPKNQTFAELGDEAKNRVSHRARALAKLRDELKAETLC